MARAIWADNTRVCFIITLPKSPLVFSSSPISFLKLFLSPTPRDQTVPVDTTKLGKEGQHHKIVTNCFTNLITLCTWKMDGRISPKDCAFKIWLLTNLNQPVRFFWLFSLQLLSKLLFAQVYGKKRRVMTQSGEFPPPRWNGRSAAKTEVEPCVFSAQSPITRTSSLLHCGSFSYILFPFLVLMKGLMYQ